MTNFITLLYREFGPLKHYNMNKCGYVFHVALQHELVWLCVFHVTLQHEQVWICVFHVTLNVTLNDI